MRLDPSQTLPEDGLAGTLVARVWEPGAQAGPSVAVLDRDGVFALDSLAPTTSHLFELPDAVAAIRAAPRTRRLGSVEDILANTIPDSRDPAKPWFLAPIDLQTVKAAGVTFAASLLERVIEERAKGDPARQAAIRDAMTAEIGQDLRAVIPGSESAEKLRRSLVERDLWSQYLEVGIGPDAEVFTKTASLASVGTGVEIGIHPKSVWNNPEPEIVMVVNSRGETVGATLGNDVNLRDVEGRSALLLGRAKDNNGSSAIGPFIRLFDGSFSIDDVRQAEVYLTVEGREGFKLEGHSSMAMISRDPLDLVGQTIGPNHDYPDGFVLFLGTMYAPTQDREAPGEGFTHRLGDIVTVRSAKLGALVNRVNHSDKVPRWTLGTRALMDNLKLRGLL